MLRGGLLVLLGWLALAAPALAAGPTFPALTGRVVDAANVIPDDVEARLIQKLAALETQSHRQLVVVTLPDLQGYEISDYGYQLGRAWGIGSKDKDDGALLIVAPKERKLRIEVGYGLEGVLTDGFSSLIISQQIVPKLKAGDLPGGIEAGTDAIVHQLTLPPAEAQALAAQPPKGDTATAIAVIAGFVGVFVFIFVIIWLVARAARRSGRSYAGAGAAPVTVWDTSSSSDSGWSSSDSDSFSGGGGDFGGGGASGDW